jgi:hypothetical protein
MRISIPFLTGIASAVMAVIFASCGSGGNPGPTPWRAERVLYHWYDDGGPGRVSVSISLSDQIAEFRRGARDIGWCYVATGKEGHGTCPGNYQIMEKIVDKYSGSFGWIEDELGNVTNGDATPGTPVPKGMVYVPAPMPYWMRITGYGIGMHGGLIPEPGKPASHGCIRMPKEFVPELFEVVEVGTPVTITAGPGRHHPQGDNPPPQWAVQPSAHDPSTQVPGPWVGDRRVIATRPLGRGGR